MKIAEVKSRFVDVDQFIKDIELVGYTLRNMVNGFTLVTDFYWDAFFFFMGCVYE